MAHLTTTLSKNTAWEQIAKGDDKTMAQKILEPIQIDERQYNEIHSENMKNETFQQHQEDVEQSKLRWERALRDSTKALKEYDIWSTKLECLPLIIQARDEGKIPKGDDKNILEMGGEALEKKVDELRKMDDMKNKDEDRARSKFVEAEKAWREFAIMRGQPFAYKSDGRYFRIGGGTISLRQRTQETLEEVGADFRKALITKNDVTKITYTDIVKVLERYERAAPLGSHDRGQISEVLNFVRENPKCSPEKIDPQTEKDQVYDQGRADFMISEKRRKRLAPYKEHLTEEERIRYGLTKTEQRDGNRRRDRNRDRSDNHRRRTENRRTERREDRRWTDRRPRSDRDRHDNYGNSGYRHHGDNRNAQYHNNGYGRQQYSQQNRGFQGGNRGRGNYRNNNFENQRRGNAQPSNENKS
ncbi:unnamed protein product [Oikopleura dioica]|uniref:Uncharacterized protein n=1 Tax=Oikopleura dioica TaxID=34765 RepID=E4XLC7_OIKDI|nr:unnamed protein product [Oikopleura dioica]